MTIYMNFPIFITREVDLTEAIVDEGVAPIFHSYMLYPNERRSQYKPIFRVWGLRLSILVPSIESPYNRYQYILQRALATRWLRVVEGL